MDPRLASLRRRLGEVRRILAVTGGKGGIGKSLVATTAALLSSEAGRATGLLDLDLTGPSDHVILGAEGGFPAETFGIDPPRCHGLSFLSITHFAGETPAPLRGADVTNALLEVLAITRWGPLDLLVIDMPPGLGDATLDAVRLLPEAEYLVVGTASRVVLETVRRMLRFLDERGVRLLGLLENMRAEPTGRVEALAGEREVPFLGALPLDPKVEAALGLPPRLLETAFARALRALLPAWEAAARPRRP